MKFKLTILFSLFGAILFCQTGTEKTFTLGVIEELNSTLLGEKRKLNIYLPEGYSKNDTTKYAVVYLLDGGADEDFIHVTGLFQFNNFSWINRVPKSIVVGLCNTDRKRDMTFPTSVEDDKKKYPTTGGSDKFMQFIEKELQPFIEKNYKCNASKMLIGQSLGGLFAAEVLLKKPTLFDKYIIISPSIWWDNGSLLKTNSELLQKNFTQATSISIGVGKEGPTPSIPPRIMEDDAKAFFTKIKSVQNKNIKVSFDFLPAEDHATISHQAIFNALRILYPEKKNEK
jgi:predicted alpha/beta superfamily hydrolase